MTSDLSYLKDVIENYSHVTIHYRDDCLRPVSVKCSFGQEIRMVGSTIVVAWAVKEYERTRARMIAIELETVLMVVADYLLAGPDRLERLFMVRGTDGVFDAVRTEVW
jgi:hypothetical protein